MKTLRFLPRFACLAFPLLSALAQAAESGPTIPLPDEDRMAIEKYLGTGVVGQAIPAPESLIRTGILPRIPAPGSSAS